MPRNRGAPARAAAPRPKPAAMPQQQQPARPAQPQYSAPPPAPAAHAPPPAMQQPSSGGGMLSGLMGTVVQGAALGTGSAMAHRAVDAMMGGRGGGGEAAPAPVAAAPEAYSPPPTAGEGPCGAQAKAFAECMSRNNADMGACQFYFEAMQQCKVGHPYV